MLDGNLYVATGLHQVASIDAGTGKTRWVYDPGIYKRGTPQRLGALVHESELASNDPSPCRSPPDGVRRRPAPLSHLIEDVACEDGLSPPALPDCAREDYPR